MNSIWTMINSMNTTQWLSFLFITIFILYIWEQINYKIKRGSLPGPKLTLPFLGGIIHMIISPYRFWHGQMNYGKLSWNSIIGKYFVLVADNQLSRKVFEKCSSDLPLVLHPNANRLLGNDNIAFMNGHIHKTLRMTLLPLFTTKALSTYLYIQEKAIREHMIKWSQLNQSNSNRLEMRPLIYDLNINTSLSVFIGPYLNDEMRQQFKNDYQHLTKGFFAPPIYFPGTQLYKGVVGANSIRKSLQNIVRQCKQRMSIDGQEPKCLLDFWIISVLNSIKESQLKNEAMPLHSTDEEIAKITLDFLFAAQDASTSSLTFAIHELGKHQQILDKIRQEQKTIRSNRFDPITPSMLSEMKYTWQVMKELLRLRPPATLAIHMAKKPFQISEQYTAPKGTLVIPSIWSSNRFDYPQPELFDPERFNSDRMEHLKYEKNFLTFGAGPHACLGQRYAMNHIMLFISLLSDCDFQRATTDNMDQIMYLPTIYPADGCLLNYFNYNH